MKGLLQKIKDWYAKIRVKKESYKISGIKPVHDWRIILISTQIIIIILAIVAFYFFTQIEAGKFFVVKEKKTEKDIKIDDTLLKKTVDDINSRKTTFDEIKNGGVPADPSL